MSDVVDHGSPGRIGVAIVEKPLSHLMPGGLSNIEVHVRASPLQATEELESKRAGDDGTGTRLHVTKVVGIGEVVRQLTIDVEEIWTGT